MKHMFALLVIVLIGSFTVFGQGSSGSDDNGVSTGDVPSVDNLQDRSGSDNLAEPPQYALEPKWSEQESRFESYLSSTQKDNYYQIKNEIMTVQTELNNLKGTYANMTTAQRQAAIAAKRIEIRDRLSTFEDGINSNLSYAERKAREKRREEIRRKRLFMRQHIERVKERLNEVGGNQ